MSYQRKGIKRTAIVPKLKKCKGVGICAGYGCAMNTYKRTRGLCDKCNARWLLTTPEGQDVMNKSILKAPKTRIKIERKEHKVKVDKFLDTDISYWKGILQSNINVLVRLIDYGQLCTARNIPAGKMVAGHIYSRGSTPSAKYNLHNIVCQSTTSNHWQNEDGLLRDGVVRVFGQEYFDFVRTMQGCPTLKHSASEYKAFVRKVQAINKEMKKDLVVRTPAERIELRNRFNTEIGIYHPPFSLFSSPQN